MPVRFRGESSIEMEVTELRYRTGQGPVEPAKDFFEPNKEQEVFLRDVYSQEAGDSEVLKMYVKLLDIGPLCAKAVGEIVAPSFHPLARWLSKLYSKSYEIRLTKSKMSDSEARLSERSWF